MDQDPRTINQIDVTSIKKRASPPRNMPYNRPMGSRSNVPCLLFKNGNCSYGQYCRFSHADGFRNNVAMNVNEGKNRNFVRNETVARYGKTGHKMTRLCYKWEATGSCFKGADCTYAHGREELGKVRSQFDVQQEVVSNSRIRPATTAPNGSPCGTADGSRGTADGSATDQDKKWKINKKLNGIYADWIDERPLMHRSVDEEGI